jgi:hypothetical protein
MRLLAQASDKPSATPRLRPANRVAFRLPKRKNVEEQRTDCHSGEDELGDSHSLLGQFGDARGVGRVRPSNDTDHGVDALRQDRTRQDSGLPIEKIERRERKGGEAMTQVEDGYQWKGQEQSAQ